MKVLMLLTVILLGSLAGCDDKAKRPPASRVTPMFGAPAVTITAPPWTWAGVTEPQGNADAKEAFDRCVSALMKYDHSIDNGFAEGDVRDIRSAITELAATTIVSIAIDSSFGLPVRSATIPSYRLTQMAAVIQLDGETALKAGDGARAKDAEMALFVVGYNLMHRSRGTMGEWAGWRAGGVFIRRALALQVARAAFDSVEAQAAAAAATRLYQRDEATIDAWRKANPIVRQDDR